MNDEELAEYVLKGRQFNFAKTLTYQSVMVLNATSYGSKPPLVFLATNMNFPQYIQPILQPVAPLYLPQLVKPIFEQLGLLIVHRLYI